MKSCSFCAIFNTAPCISDTQHQDKESHAQNSKDIICIGCIHGVHKTHNNVVNTSKIIDPLAQATLQSIENTCAFTSVRQGDR